MSYKEELIQCAAVCLAAAQNFEVGTTSLKTNQHTLSGLIQNVFEERVRQEIKWGAQDRTPENWMVILMEEVGEAAKDVLEKNY